MKRILVIDSNKAFRVMIGGFLSSLGYEVEMLDGTSINQIHKLKEISDLIFIDNDIFDQEKTGDWIQFKKKKPFVPIVLLVGRQSKNGHKPHHRWDFDILLFKPFKLLDIQNTVIRLIGAPE